MSDVLVLDAGGLCSKWGFCDGDIFLEDPYGTWLLRDVPGWRASLKHELLCWVVERHLAPLIPGVVVERVMSCHNPIRAVSFGGVPWDSFTSDSHPSTDGVVARVPWADVVAVAMRLVAEDGAADGGAK